MTVIEVASIRPPRAPRSPGHVIDAGGAAFECWPEKLNKLEVGQRYAVEVETREWQGRPIRKIIKAQPADYRATPGNGHHPAKPAASQAAQPQPGRGSEQAFVASIVSAFIAAGKVDLDRGQLEQAVTLARALWRCTLGGGHG
jgi:hypothetical protein